MFHFHTIIIELKGRSGFQLDLAVGYFLFINVAQRKIVFFTNFSKLVFGNSLTQPVVCGCKRNNHVVTMYKK